MRRDDIVRMMSILSPTPRSETNNGISGESVVQRLKLYFGHTLGDKEAAALFVCWAALLWQADEAWSVKYCTTGLIITLLGCFETRSTSFGRSRPISNSNCARQFNGRNGCLSQIECSPCGLDDALKPCLLFLGHFGLHFGYLRPLDAHAWLCW